MRNQGYRCLGTDILVGDDFDVLDMASGLKDLTENILSNTRVQASDVQGALVWLGGSPTRHVARGVARGRQHAGRHGRADGRGDRVGVLRDDDGGQGRRGHVLLWRALVAAVIARRASRSRLLRHGSRRRVRIGHYGEFKIKRSGKSESRRQLAAPRLCADGRTRRAIDGDAGGSGPSGGGVGASATGEGKSRREAAKEGKREDGAQALLVYWTGQESRARKGKRKGRKRSAGGGYEGNPTPDNDGKLESGLVDPLWGERRRERFGRGGLQLERGPQTALGPLDGGPLQGPGGSESNE